MQVPESVPPQDEVDPNRQRHHSHALDNDARSYFFIYKKLTRSTTLGSYLSRLSRLQ
jgi:hypothetical protein